MQKGRDRRGVLLEDIEDIQLQLGVNRTKRTPDSLDWRARACTALRIKKREYRFLNNWLKEKRKNAIRKSKQLDPENPISYIKASYDLLASLKSEGIDFKESELSLIGELKAFMEDKATA